MRTTINPSMLTGYAGLAISNCIMDTKTNKDTHEKVIHVAYGCGCVQTFHVKRFTPDMRCATHGDHQLSFTEEWVNRPKCWAA